MRAPGTVVFLVLCLALDLKAQTRRAPADLSTARRLVGITVTGSHRYSQAEVVAASGLTIGSSASDEDFKKASQQLGDTGMFSDVAYAFSYSAAGTKLDLQLTDVAKLVPVYFENFVWFTEDDLRSQLRTRVPLFQGSVPTSGSLLEQLNDALQALLLEKHFPGRVDYLRIEAEDGGEINGIDFSVNDIKVLIQSIAFSGTAPSEEAALAAASTKLMGADYKRAQIATYANYEWIPIYLQRGYLKASFGEPQAKVVAQKEQTVEVAVTMPVQPGGIYNVDAAEWTGNHVFPTERLNALLHMPIGEPANALRLKGDLEAAEKMYGTKGYMAAKVQSEATLDDASHTVRYTIHVNEGDQYKMGELEILGLDANTAARVQRSWSIREGEPYDASYASGFLNEAIKVLPKDVTWSVDLHESPDVDEKTVDVNLRFFTK